MTQPEEMPSVVDVMNSHVHTLSQEMSLTEAIKFLLHHSISSAPVVEDVNKQMELVGVFSEADGLRHLSAQLFFGNGNMDDSVGSVMKRHPICIEPNTDVFGLASIFVSHDYRHLPVVEDNQLIGIVSRRDILGALLDFHEKSDRKHEQQRARPDLKKLINLRFFLRGS